MNKHEWMDSMRHLSPEGLAMLGAPSLAYIREIEVENGTGWGIFAANGQQMGVVADREVAFMAARQHDLSPVYVN